MCVSTSERASERACERACVRRASDLAGVCVCACERACMRLLCVCMCEEKSFAQKDQIQKTTRERLRRLTEEVRGVQGRGGEREREKPQRPRLVRFCIASCGL
jgi:hypothetical protein